MKLQALLVLALGGAAAVGASAKQSGPRITQPLPAEIAAYYAIAPLSGPAEIRQIEKQRDYLVQRVILPMPIPQRPIRMVWFAPRQTAPGPLILISPIKGSNKLVSDGFARTFASEGYHAVIVQRLHIDYDATASLTQTEEHMRTAVARNRQALDWLLTQPEIDGTRVGTFGISYGAIVNAIFAGVEPRAQCHIFALAGGPLPDVLKMSRERSLRRDWKATRRHHGLTSAELKAALRETIRSDPVLLAPYVDSKRVLMVIARYDYSVGTRNSVRFWKALGKPAVINLPLGHYTTVLALPILRARALEFFAENFTADQKRRETTQNFTAKRR